jgi:hypothetical protein
MDLIKAKTIVSAYKDNPYWFGTQYNMNIYRGCSRMLARRHVFLNT